MMIPRSTPFTRAALFVAVLLLPLLPRIALGQTASVLPDGSSVGLTRFELQRSLLEVDEQRRRLEVSIEPVDSVLRMMARDSARIAALARAPIVDRDASVIRSLVRQLRLAPGSPELTARLVTAVNRATHDFSAADSGLATRVMIGGAGRDFLSRSANAGIVVLDVPPPPYDTPVWDKIRQSDYGRQPLAPITDEELTGFRYALSDTGFTAYKSVLTSAFSRRMAEVRQARDSSRADVQRLRRRASELAHVIGSQQDSSVQLDTRLITIALPLFVVVLVIVLFAPRVYRSPELQAYIFTSGLLLEIATLVLVTGTVLALGLGGRIHAEVIGTLLGALTGFLFGRAVPRGRVELLTPAPVVAPPGAYTPPPQPVAAPVQRRRRPRAGQPAAARPGRFR